MVLRNIYYDKVLNSMLSRNIYYVKVLKSMLLRNIYYGKVLKSMLSRNIFYGKVLKSMLSRNIFYGKVLKSMLSRNIYYDKVLRRVQLVEQQLSLLPDFNWVGGIGHLIFLQCLWTINCMFCFAHYIRPSWMLRLFATSLLFINVLF